MLYDELVELNCLNKRTISGIKENQLVLIKEDINRNRSMEYIKRSEFLTKLSNGELKYYITNMEKVTELLEYLQNRDEPHLLRMGLARNESFRRIITKVEEDVVTYNFGRSETLDLLEDRIRNSQGYISNIYKLKEVLRG